MELFCRLVLLGLLDLPHPDLLRLWGLGLGSTTHGTIFFFFITLKPRVE